VDECAVDDASAGVVVNKLAYNFPGGQNFMQDFCMKLPLGSRCLLLGCNGTAVIEVTHVRTSSTPAQSVIDKQCEHRGGQDDTSPDISWMFHG
jgi:hypothetical protein